MDRSVAEAFSAIAMPARATLLDVRELVFRTAADQGVAPVEESLKWGQPSYAPAQPRTGSPVRLGVNGDGRPTVYCHCQTGLIEAFRERYPDQFAFEGNRALVLEPGQEIPADALQHCLALALTYHREKRGRR